MTKNNQPTDKKPKKTPWWSWLWFAGFALLIIAMLIPVGPTPEEVPFTDFLHAMQNEEIAEVTITYNELSYLTKEEAAKPEAEQKLYMTLIPPGGDALELSERLCAQGIKVNVNPKSDNSLLISFLPVIISATAMFFLARYMLKRMGNMGGSNSNKAKVYAEKDVGVTFKDVAGQDEAKESLQEVINFLHNPTSYTEIGARLPKGILLVGSPGTGKTLLAKAVAGEAKVPFFSISGSDFDEVFVGVGASRVRTLFQDAAKVAPCIIFIDEIDAVGRTRDSKNSVNDQTINQLLSEFDGFDSNKGIVCIGATNRPEVLDKALLRPGRFDRRVVVDTPNLQGRYDTLKVHSAKVKLAEDVDLMQIAKQTAGAVGADLANLVNEAALRAVRNGRQAVTQEDLMLSFETIIAGHEKKNAMLSDEEKKRIAYHEAGHAIVSALDGKDMPVSKITIVPRTDGALGYTLYLPDKERFTLTKAELESKIKGLLGGRAAEDVALNEISTGASNDIQRATDIARKMVAMYGMSDELGLMAPATVSHAYLGGAAQLDCANETAAKVDQAVQDMLTKLYNETKQALSEHSQLLEVVTQLLLEKESITGDEFMEIMKQYTC